MATIKSYTPGSFCWGELATSDADASKKFYGEMFGWTTVDHPMPNGVYTMFQLEGEDVGAVYQAPPGMPTAWGLYFSATNVDESAAQIAQLHGKVVMGPMDVGESGRMVVAQDPQGAYFSLWQAKQHIGATYGGPLGNMMWPELQTPDAAGAIAFYSSLLGWKTKPESGFESAEYIEWIHDGRSMGGLLPMRGDMWKGIPPHWGFYVTVADCDDRAKKAADLGSKLYVPPKDIPNVGRFSVIGDPQGAVFSIIKMTASHQPAGA